ncbi:hypothetical protein FPZ24_10340 [Sphingomonas panacisoli]|uniref:DUF1440 domain-containing protein n=1 Tax=Sphingomonas panacisoli TaxID=1813879 RepID=A0A5B8LJS5_9SPHN|nr:hypothetical protein [Sphingomonas panacisoli]QDZ07834.1 hypothetical protein FPZ24_10340 [Sphingomonas panacisoli]
MGQSVSRRVVTATLVAGTLDILSAVVYTLIAGKQPINMLKGLASAVLGDDAVKGGSEIALAGLGIHFAIMAVMVAFFVIVADRLPVLKTRWVMAGIGYGIGLWAIMSLVVLPMRYGFHPFKPLGLAEQFFSHIVLVGLPIAWFARK